MENVLKGFLELYGTYNNEGVENFFDAESNGIYAAWSYWDDNDDTHYDNDAYIKKMVGITEDNEGNIVIVWDGNFKEAFNRLDDDCQEYILEQVTEWIENSEELSSFYNLGNLGENSERYALL